MNIKEKMLMVMLLTPHILLLILLMILRLPLLPPMLPILQMKT